MFRIKALTEWSNNLNEIDGHNFTVKEETLGENSANSKGAFGCFCYEKCSHSLYIADHIRNIFLTQYQSSFPPLHIFEIIQVILVSVQNLKNNIK